VPDRSSSEDLGGALATVIAGNGSSGLGGGLPGSILGKAGRELGGNQGLTLGGPGAFADARL